MFDIVCSIVIYKSERIQLLSAIKSFLNTSLNVKLLLIDNSPTDTLKDVVIDERCEYFHNPGNPGYGTSHNVGVKRSAHLAKYYLVLNPDVYFRRCVIEELFFFMEKNSTVGLLMPKVLYPNGEVQYLAKLLPNPWYFISRRLIPFGRLSQWITEKYELRYTGYNTIMEAPYLSGCFMFFRSKVVAEINGFDENIFMHMEDLDISRRSLETGYKNVYYPNQFIYHDHIFKHMYSYSNLKMYLTSALYYFNKWGWFFDKDRCEINKRTILNWDKSTFE